MRTLKEGLKKTENYPHFVDKGGGPSNANKQWGRSSHVDIKIP